MFGSPGCCEGQHNESIQRGNNTVLTIQTPQHAPGTGCLSRTHMARAPVGVLLACVCACLCLCTCAYITGGNLLLYAASESASTLLQFTLLFFESLPICCGFNCYCLAEKDWSSCQRITHPLLEQIDATRRTAGRGKGFRIQGITTAHLRPGRLRRGPAWRDVQSQKGQLGRLKLGV